MDNFKDNETDIQHLIISSLEGTASEEELLVLQKWLEEEPERCQIPLTFVSQTTSTRENWEKSVNCAKKVCTRPRRLGRK